MKIKFKKLNIEGAQIEPVEPRKATVGAAGFDMVAIGMNCGIGESDGCYFFRYHTGIALELPPGWMALAFPRSSIVKKNAYLGNSVGVINSDYRGEITFCFKGQTPYRPGDRIGQLVIIPAPDVVLEEAVELSETERGAGGYGSTGA